jgi:hypothetical protein
MASHEGTLEWVPRGRLDTLQLVEDLPVLLPRVLDMQAGDQVLSAQYSYDAAGKLLIRFAQTD